MSTEPEVQSVNKTLKLFILWVHHEGGLERYPRLHVHEWQGSWRFTFLIQGIRILRVVTSHHESGRCPLAHVRDWDQVAVVLIGKSYIFVCTSDLNCLAKANSSNCLLEKYSVTGRVGLHFEEDFCCYSLDNLCSELMCTFIITHNPIVCAVCTDKEWLAVTMLINL